MNPNAVINLDGRESGQARRQLENAEAAEEIRQRLRNRDGVRVYLAPRNSKRLAGNRATRARRQAGFAAMISKKHPARKAFFLP